MTLVNYRDEALFAQLLQKIAPVLAEHAQALGRKVRIMEVCGTHTVAFARTGVRQVLEEYADLLSGPGCPVCVTDQADIDHMIAFAQQPEAIVATFGDMMKVPGSKGSLYQERAEGADVRVVYSPAQAVELAKENPQKQVIFLGVGFETTAPGIALGMKQAVRERVDNLFVYSAHKLTPPAVLALVADPAHQIDGFLLPGHVSVIIGRRGWSLLEEFNLPAVIGGFEPLDLLVSVYQLIQEMKKGRRRVVNGYPRIVREEGNPIARALLAEVFEAATVDWRGLGPIPRSGLDVAPAYRRLDAKRAIEVAKPETKAVKGCRCGEVVKGLERPLQCPLFARVCTPENPLGPCMVSSEGACSAYYLYGEDETRQGGAHANPALTR